MKAVRVSKFGGANVMKIKGNPYISSLIIYQNGSYYGPCNYEIFLEINIPKVESNEVLIKVRAAGINPLDTYIRSGQFMPTYLPTLPYTPGGDVCGEVVEVGSDVSEFSIGDKGCVFTLR